AFPKHASFFQTQIAKFDIERVLPMEAAHALADFGLPRYHRDPFDRMLIAQAREDGLILVSRDQALAAYDVETLW
ncbi:MAG TPA: type II toxin-antitoxin system VapC family toxin, partial [Blastocatellia bacterium]|nr:type II toxin-antitoxin system VapC family toxin [Blastocatellia bacterium]